MSETTQSPAATAAAAAFAGAEPVRVSRRGGVRQVKKSLPEEFIDPETGEPFRRRSPQAAGSGIFELRPESKRKGWDYQWVTVSVLNQPVDQGTFVTVKDAGWRPVSPEEMPEEVPPGWQGKTIERGGQVLMKRPEYLSNQARKEQKEAADKALHDKYAQAQLTPPGSAKRINTGTDSRFEPLPDDLRAQYEGADAAEEFE
jgi:hypothetical protein